jgi:hypothetical protein
LVFIPSSLLSSIISIEIIERKIHKVNPSNNIEIHALLYKPVECPKSSLDLCKELIEKLIIIKRHKRFMIFQQKAPS